MNQQQQRMIETEQLQRLNAAASAMDRLAAVRRQRTGTEPVRWQMREPARAVNRWRLAA